MTAEQSIGVLFLVLGGIFLLVPLPTLQKVFHRMRSKWGTKIGGGVLAVAGVAMLLWVRF
ncbi:hypothetical protein [Flavonifractor hominis]|uniref:Uncharacterized protein n=1 Tax=Flavonifractor hominis TaxID=3133178 RepID=A0ABV1ESQ6_9FIRM